MDIERTRNDMGDTVEALAHKADVPTRTKEWLGDKKEAVVAKVSGASDKVSELTPDGREVKQTATGLKRTAERNPLGLAIAGAAAGFIAGLLTPSTRVEDERIGPMSDELKSTAADTGREALERGKLVAQEAGTTAMETAKEVGQEQTEELTQNLQSQARESFASDPERAPSR
jgi:gas vesicle protein